MSQIYFSITGMKLSGLNLPISILTITNTAIRALLRSVVRGTGRSFDRTAVSPPGKRPPELECFAQPVTPVGVASRRNQEMKMPCTRQTDRINQRRKTRFAICSILALAAIALSGCGGGGEKTFSTPTYPFSFSYPEDWKLTRNAAFNYGAGSGKASVSVSLKDPYDQVTITQYKLKKTLGEGVNGNRKELDRIVAKLTVEAKGTASEGEIVEYGGIPGYKYFVEYSSPDGTELRNQLVFLFKGDDEFQINCQSTDENREQLEQGCNLVLDTLKFD